MQDAAKVATDDLEPFEDKMFIVAMKRLSRQVQDIQTEK